MDDSCSILPKRGTKTYSKLWEDLGREDASLIFNAVTNPEYINKHNLKVDREGIPTYNSIMNDTNVKNYLGDKALDSLNKTELHLENTIENNNKLLKRAEFLNKENPSYITYVDYDSDGKLTITYHPKTQENIEIFETQQKINKLNTFIADTFSDIGFNIGILDDIEVAAGRVGVTNFNHATEVAGQIVNMIKIANNMEGAVALSEEFSHLLVAINRNSPLVQRGLTYLSNEANAKQYLGDKYNDISEYYNGDSALIAEEALGQILQEAFIQNIDGTTKEAVKQPLLKRIISFIKNLFKGYNAGAVQSNIDAIKADMSELSKKYLDGDLKLTKRDILKTKRIQAFNALSEKAKIQIDVLKKAEDNMMKAAALQQNFSEKLGDNTEKSKSRKIAEEFKTSLREGIAKEETMLATGSFLDLATRNLKNLYSQLENIDQLPTQDKFICLRNVLFTLQAYGPTIDDLYTVTTTEYLQDEHIKNQKFVGVEDVNNEFSEAQTDDSEVESVDTKNMNPKDIVDVIHNNNTLQLTDDELFYIDSNGNKYLRVTKLIEADENGEIFDPNNPWITPSTNIGTGIDELTRDFFSGRIHYEGTDSNNKPIYTVEGKLLSEVYPNADERDLVAYCSQLYNLQKKFKEKGITIEARDITLNGIIHTIDSAGTVHNVRVAGTLDLLGHDKDGNFYIFDMKTHHGTISMNKKAKWSRQLSVYKQFLEEKYGVKVKEMGVIPIQVHYPSPKGVGTSTNEYTVSQTSPSEYNGKHPNQLLLNGKEFKGAKPWLGEILPIESRELHIDYKKLSGDPTGGLGGGIHSVVQSLDLVNRLYKQFNRAFVKKALPEFVKFLEPYVGSTLPIKNKDGKFIDVPLEKIIAPDKDGDFEVKDVGLMSAFFTTMADSSDMVLQMYDRVYKITKGEARLESIDKLNEITALGLKYEKEGITNYDFMYEEDNKNYVNHTIINGEDYSYNYYKYRQALQEMQDYLDSKYGKNPEIGSDDYKNKKSEKIEWFKENKINVFDKETNTFRQIPDPKKFPSRYSSFTETQKRFYDEFMTIKAGLDSMLGPGKTYLNRTIRIRKSGIERTSDILKEGKLGTLVEELKSKVKKDFTDELNYTKGTRGFNGEEILQLPLYFLKSKTTSDISHDAISTLAAYANMCYDYKALSSINNALEIGREILNSERNNQIIETRSGKNMRESFNVGGRTINNPIYKRNSNIAQQLNWFMESKIYQRYVADSGEILGMDTNKLTSLLLKLGSTVQLGANVFANAANVVTGINLQNLEALAGEYFTASELANADKEFMKGLGSYVGDIGSRKNNSKLSLMDRLFNVRQDYKNKVNSLDFKNRTILTRIFGPSLQFFGQDAGDFWLYNRTFIAMALRKQVMKDGEKMSLWEAIGDPVEIEKGKDYGSKLDLSNIKNLDGSDFTKRDIISFGLKVNELNKHLFGVYSDEDMVMARKYTWGRFVMQYRDWIPSALVYRFGEKHWSIEKEGYVEGYYRTAGRFIKQSYTELKNGEKNIKQLWSELSEPDKMRILRCRNEIIQYACILAVALWLRGFLKNKDKKRYWALQYISYMLSRETQELGALVPGVNAKEMLSILKSPMAATSVVNSITGLYQVFNPYNYFEEVESGKYEGHTKAFRAWANSPLSLWYKNYVRFQNPAEAEQWYWQ